MENKIGLWIDHRKAIIVAIKNDEHELQTLHSNIEKRVRASGGSRTKKTPWGPQDIVAEDRIFRKYKKHLVDYYKRVLEILEDYDLIYILGPGRAKKELVAEIRKLKSFSNKILHSETVDKLTERQVIAKVKKHFNNG